MPTIFTVTSTGDNGGMNPEPGQGTGTLRQAIIDADAAESGTVANPDLIQFDIPSTDSGYNSELATFTIQPLAALPGITNIVTIDGYSEPGSSPNTLASGENAVLNIVLYGNSPSLDIAASNCTVRGLVIDGFKNFGNGIFVGGSHDTITGSYIGIDPTGTKPMPNNDEGIEIESSYNTIGGVAPGDRNVISGNDGEGIRIDGAGLVDGASFNLVEGNYIGTNAAGTSAVANTAVGVSITGTNTSSSDPGATNNTIGGTAAGAGNVISGNGLNNALVNMNIVGKASGNVVEGNIIGLAAGSVPLDPMPLSPQVKEGEGVGIGNGPSDNTIGGTAPGAGNLISGNVTGIVLANTSGTRARRSRTT